MEESIIEPPTLEDIDQFMIITPLPEIKEEIDFFKVFKVDKHEMEILNESRKEFRIAITTCLADVKLGIREGESYLEKLMEALGKYAINKPKKVTILWGRVFTEVGKTKIKIVPK